MKLVVLLISSDPDLGKAHPLVRIEEPDGKACVGQLDRARNRNAAAAVSELSVRRQGTSRERMVERIGRPASGRPDSARGAWKQGRGRTRPRSLRGIRATRAETAPPTGPTAANAPPPSIRAVLVADAGRRSRRLRATTVQVTDKALTAKSDQALLRPSRDVQGRRGRDVPVQPPLGWVLSTATRKGLDELVGRCGNKEQLARARGGSRRTRSAAGRRGLPGELRRRISSNAFRPCVKCQKDVLRGWRPFTTAR